MTSLSRNNKNNEYGLSAIGWCRITAPPGKIPTTTSFYHPETTTFFITLSSSKGCVQYPGDSQKAPAPEGRAARFDRLNVIWKVINVVKVLISIPLPGGRHLVSTFYSCLLFTVYYLLITHLFPPPGMLTLYLVQKQNSLSTAVPMATWS